MAAKVLVIEDNADQWLIINAAMRHALPDAEPVHVENEAQALAYIDTCAHTEVEPPKLILLDLYLPRPEDGWHLLQEIKNRPAPFNQLPVVILSNSSNDNDVLESYQQGAASYLVKPTDFDSWLDYFESVREYWWRTVTLPRFSLLW